MQFLLVYVSLGDRGFGVYTQGKALRVHPSILPKSGCSSDLPLI